MPLSACHSGRIGTEPLVLHSAHESHDPCAAVLIRLAGYAAASRSAITCISAPASQCMRPAASRPMTVRWRSFRLRRFRGERERRPDLRAHREVEPMRRDADDFERLGRRSGSCVRRWPGRRQTGAATTHR